MNGILGGRPVPRTPVVGKIGMRMDWTIPINSPATNVIPSDESRPTTAAANEAAIRAW